jgi:hypothetical protein
LRRGQRSKQEARHDSRESGMASLLQDALAAKHLIVSSAGRPPQGLVAAGRCRVQYELAARYGLRSMGTLPKKVNAEGASRWRWPSSAPASYNY